MTAVDLAVAYRIYPGISKSPAAFPGDKLLFSELCLRSFRRALGDVRVKVHALLDGCPPEYEALFREYFRPEELVVHPFPRIGNFGTFREQIRILLAQEEAEAVYFAEDDYLYLPGSFPAMLDFLGTVPDAHFITPYEHPDYYHLPLHRYREEVRVLGDRRWRTAGTTCLTFLTTKRVLSTARSGLERFCRGSADASVWLTLTKRGVFDPVRTTRYLFTDRMHFSIVAGAWWYGCREVLFGRRYKLWVPIPGVATQMEITVLAAGYDWPGEIRKAQEEMLRLRRAGGGVDDAGKGDVGCPR